MLVYPYELMEWTLPLDQAPGIGRTGMISTDSPGKIVKCGGSGRLAPVRLPVIGATHNGQR
jgi:hypothetical protein